MKEQLRQESNLPYEMLKARHSSRLHVTCHLTIIYANYASFFMIFYLFLVQDNESAIDYRKLYEDERLKNETQKKQNSGTRSIVGYFQRFLDYIREITQLKQRIASLEMETNKLDDICADNSKLKQENAALIRIISKLNKH